MKHRIIGVFDSGVGGKLIVGKISTALPGAKVIFKSDSKYFPYGDKSDEFIFRRATFLTRELLKQNCKLIVIACNSVTTNSINRLRKKFPQITFVGIEPPIKPIAKLSRTGKVAIMVTETTAKSSRVQKLKNRFAPNIKVYKIACPGLAEVIEEIVNQRSPLRYYLVSKSEKDITDMLKKFLDQPVAEGTDIIGLACTHYPYILSQMQSLYPKVSFYDPADAVVAQVKRLATK